jgi:hypothetical protein
MLMGRKPAYMSGFRPINIGCAREGDERAEPLEFPAETSPPGPLVAPTAYPARHEMPGTQFGRAEGA